MSSSTPVPASGSSSSDDPRWFDKEVHGCETALRSYLQGSYPNVRDIDDVVQESFLRVWKARLKHTIRSPRAFLFRIARNLALDALRQRRAWPIVAYSDDILQSMPEEQPGTVETACRREDYMLLAEAIQSLPGKMRAVIVLRQSRGLSQREIAAEVGLSEQSVQKYVGRALERINSYLEKRGVR